MDVCVNVPLVFGAAGFIGKHFINEIGLQNCIPVSRKSSDISPWVTADLLDINSLLAILKPGMTVINLAYSAQMSDEKNIKMAINLAEACKCAKVAKLVHCSTALVVGVNKAPLVNEETVCLPTTAYEQTKYKIEKILLEARTHDFQVCIIRPTGVIGPLGQNLKKMLSEISSGHLLMNWVRSSLYGKRPLNLVPVRDVTRAILHLSHPTISDGVYICSADEDSDNHYQFIESIARAYSIKKSWLKPINLSPVWLKTILRWQRSGSGSVAHRYYSAEKLYATGFQRCISISDAVNELISELRIQNG